MQSTVLNAGQPIGHSDTGKTKKKRAQETPFWNNRICQNERLKEIPKFLGLITLELLRPHKGSKS